MRHKSIFDIYEENTNTFAFKVDNIERMFRDVQSIYSYHENHLCPDVIEYDVFYSVDGFLRSENMEKAFPEWRINRDKLDYDSFLSVAGYEKLREQAKTNVDSFLTYVELICNLIQLVQTSVIEAAYEYVYFAYTDGMDNLMNIISTYLYQLNYRCDYDSEPGRVVIKENNSLMERFPFCTENSGKLFDYMPGDKLGKKQEKLRVLANLIEPYEKDWKAHKCSDVKNIANDVFTLLNKLDIRHNNSEKDSKDPADVNCKEILKDEAETSQLYDQLYEAILCLAFYKDVEDFAGKLDVFHKKVNELKKEKPADNTEET